MFRFVILAFIAVFALALPDAEAASRPSEVVEGAVDLLNEGLDGRKEELAADDEQKDRFISAFYATLLQRYADGILEFNMDRVEILPYRGDASKRTTVVKTNVRLDDGSKIPVHYTLVNREDQWRMFDVKIEGISYVINYRKELESEIRSTSLESVIVRLEREAGAATNE